MFCWVVWRSGFPKQLNVFLPFCKWDSSWFGHEQKESCVLKPGKQWGHILDWKIVINITRYFLCFLASSFLLPSGVCSVGCADLKSQAEAGSGSVSSLGLNHRKCNKAGFRSCRRKILSWLTTKDETSWKCSDINLNFQLCTRCRWRVVRQLLVQCWSDWPSPTTARCFPRFSLG